MGHDPKKNACQWAHEGKTLLLSGAYSEARNAFNTAIEIDPQLGRAYLGRGACHYKLGYYFRAAEDLDAAALLGCEDARLWSRFEGGDVDKPLED